MNHVVSPEIIMFISMVFLAGLSKAVVGQRSLNKKVNKVPETGNTLSKMAAKSTFLTDIRQYLPKYMKNQSGT